MKSIRKMLLIGVTVAGLGTSAVAVMAQPGTGAGQGGGQASSQQWTPEQREAKMKERVAKRAAILQEKLNLDASQQQAWDAYVASMTPQQRLQQRPDRAAWAAMSAPERMERQLARMQLMQESMGKRLEATKTFYATLKPEQQKIFNESTARMHKGGYGRHGHGHKHGHRHGGQAGTSQPS